MRRGSCAYFGGGPKLECYGTVQRLTIEQRVKVVEAYYENGRSNKNEFRALRELFGQHNRPTESAIGKIVRKFKHTGSVADVETPSRARLPRSDENIAAVRESVAEHPDTSIRHRAQELNLSRTSLQRILTNDLSLYAYKVQLTQELKPDEHLKRRAFVNWVHKQRQTDDDFLQKIIFSDEAHFRLCGFVNQLSAYDTLLCHDVLLRSMRMTLIGVMKFFCYNAYDKLILHL